MVTIWRRVYGTVGASIASPFAIARPMFLMSRKRLGSPLPRRSGGRTVLPAGSLGNIVYLRLSKRSERVMRQRVGTEDGVSATLGFGVRVMDRIDHDPQQLQLEGQGLKGFALRLNCRASREDELETLLAYPAAPG